MAAPRVVLGLAGPHGGVRPIGGLHGLQYSRGHHREEASAVRVWLRNLAIGGGVGLVIGLAVGGTLGRIFMRLVFLAEEDTLGFTTAMGATIGDFTAGGTLFIGIFGAFMGLMLGVGYVLVRSFLPPRFWWREVAFVAGSSALMLGVIVRGNRDDFTFLPTTLSLVLIAGSVALTAAPVPLLIERFAPAREGNQRRGTNALLLVGAAAIVLYSATAVAAVYSA